MAGFQQTIQPSGAVDWGNVKRKETPTDYSGVFDAANAVAVNVFENRAVEDVLGSEELPTTSVSLPLDPDQPSMVEHRRGLVDVEEISGLRGIRAAREQGILSGSRAETLATRRLNEALNQYPQHREAILAAYDRTVDPLGKRGGSIFDATAQEEAAIEQQKREAKLEQDAITAGFDSYQDQVAWNRQLQSQAEMQAVEDQKFQKQENILKARGGVLETNIWRGTAQAQAEISTMVLQQVEGTGGLDSQTTEFLVNKINQAELDAKAKLSRYRANPQFDFDAAETRIEESYAGMRKIVESQNNGAKVKAALEEMKSIAESASWQKAPNITSLISLGNSTGVDILSALSRVTGAQATNENIQKQLESLVSDPAMISQMSRVLEGTQSVAEITPDERQQFVGTLNTVKQVITDAADYDNIVSRMSDGAVANADDIANGTKELPPVDEPADPTVALLADPKNNNYYNSQEGRAKAEHMWANANVNLMKQVARDAEGSEWYLDAQGNVRGRTLIGKMRNGQDRYVYHQEATDMVNRVILPALKQHPYLLEMAPQGAGSINDYKQLMVDLLNDKVNPTTYDDIKNMDRELPTRRGSTIEPARQSSEYTEGRPRVSTTGRAVEGRRRAQEGRFQVEDEGTPTQPSRIRGVDLTSPRTSSGLAPFNPEVNEPVDMGMGGLSTEISITEELPDGTVVNVPSLWFDVEGNPVRLDRNEAVKTALEYEEVTGTQYPRFNSIDEAVRAAEERSDRGGAQVDDRTRGLLDLIGSVEAPQGYNQVYGTNRMEPLDEMTVDEVLAFQADMVDEGSPSSAVGKYQFIRKTLRELKQRLDLSGDERFTPELQDRLAQYLLKRRGYDKFLSGEITREEFANNLAKEWASLPVVSGDRAGSSYYAGDNLNKALVTPEQILASLGE